MNPKAAIIIIGNEILSGRTLDTNTQYIAQKLSLRGIIVSETRTVSDDINEIKEAVNHLRKKYDYVFTTGGIGSTHDDVTREAISLAFGTSLELNKDALDELVKYYHTAGWVLNEAKIRMAQMPLSAQLIYNPLTGAPGFNMENVFILPGVPFIMQAMLDTIIPKLKQGALIHTKTIDLKISEEEISDTYRNFQQQYPIIEMGSYPYQYENLYHTALVLKSTNQLLLDIAYLELKQLFLSYIKD